MSLKVAKFTIGQIVKHRIFPFRGVIFDVDPVYANTEEWWNAIPETCAPAQGPAILSSARRER
jgi:heat shock protein HspQ